jgi:hypothetical protein
MDLGPDLIVSLNNPLTTHPRSGLKNRGKMSELIRMISNKNLNFPLQFRQIPSRIESEVSKIREKHQCR